MNIQAQNKMNENRVFAFHLVILVLLIATTLPTTAQEKNVESEWAHVIILGKLYDRFDVSGTVTLNPDPHHPFKFLPDSDGYDSATFLVLRLANSLVKIAIDRNADPANYDRKEFEVGSKFLISAQGLLAARKPQIGRRSSFQFDKIGLVLYPERGKVRVFNPNVDGALVPEGGLYVSGKAIPGNYVLADGRQSLLAIENGNYPIFVVGNLTEEQTNWNGTIALTGKLDPSAFPGEIWIIPEKIELIRQ
jgi:hypothetical protein